MLYLALGAVALVLFFIVSDPRRRLLKRREWRFGSAMISLAAFAGAAWMGLRGSWSGALVMIVLGVGLALSTRQPTARPPAPPAPEPMSLEEARRILGVEADASREDIQAAYARLMRVAHPDQGGTTGLAAQVNAARDRLLGRK
jgi:DnaJ-domain-containing protein 1